jgi:hypothetical protein
MLRNTQKKFSRFQVIRNSEATINLFSMLFDFKFEATSAEFQMEMTDLYYGMDVGLLDFTNFVYRDHVQLMTNLFESTCVCEQFF